jgi:hypothetical protein
MTSRKVRSVYTILLGAGLAAGLGLGLSACGSNTGLELIPEATVSCSTETPSADQQAAGANMLPGRVCGACHRAGGQAQNSPWTLSGTIYASATSNCNDQGLSGIGVDILYGQDDPKGAYRNNELQPGGSLRTNSVGNFYTATRFQPPIRIRIYDPNDPTRQARMVNLVGQDPVTGNLTRVDCNFCHYPGSPNLTGNNGRIYLP